MKKILPASLLLLGVVTAISCDNDQHVNDIVGVGPVKIDSVHLVSNTMDLHSVQSIRTFSTYPSGCDSFYNYRYEKNGMERTVTAVAVKTNGACTMAQHTKASQFTFQPMETGTYTFKFYQADNTYLTETIVVE